MMLFLNTFLYDFTTMFSLYCYCPKMVLLQKDAYRMANSVDTDQTDPLGGVWSVSTLFAQARLSENLGSLR